MALRDVGHRGSGGFGAELEAATGWAHNAPVPWHTFWGEVRWIVLVSSLVSLTCSLLLVLLYRLIPRVQRMPGWVMMRATQCDLVVSASFLMLYYVDYYYKSFKDPTSISWALVLLIATSEVSASFWRVMMYVQLVTVYLNPFNPERHRPFYPIIVGSLAVIICATCAAVLSHERHFGLACLTVWLWTLFLVPFVSFVIVGLTLHITVLCLVSNALHAATRSGRNPASISYLARQRVARHGTAYMVLHGTMLAVGLVFVALMRWGSGWEAVTAAQIIAALTCGRPVLSFVGWLVINDIFYIIFGTCSLTKHHRDREAESSLAQRCRRPSATQRGTPAAARAAAPARRALMQSASLPPLAFPTRTANLEMVEERPRDSEGQPEEGMDFSEIAEAVDALEPSEAGSIVVPDAAPRLSSAMLTSDLIRAAHAEMERRAAIVQGIAEDGFKEELRYELLYDVAYGIGELAQRELRADVLAGSRPSTGRALRKVSSTPDLGMAAGGLEPSATASALPVGGLTLADGAIRPDGISAYDRTPITTMALRARHYGCGSFRAIREAFGISPEVYARAFPNNLSEHDPGWRQRLKESVSEGASGSFFYHVRSNTGGNITSHFIVKQISPKEKRTLMRFLHRYQNHVVEQRGRSLIQYFGCHSMSLRWRFSGKVYFVVMRNFLPVQQWLVFDLKGATANRRALATNLLHQMHAGADPRGGAAYGTLRDWEWMDIAMVVDVSREDKASLAEMIDKDAAFLASQGLLDYSLLIGIHRLPSDLPPQQRECRVRELKASGGYLSLDRQKVYFFGIIDVLERYNSRWRVQHACLTVGYWLALKGEHADGISAMPPHEYADRFRTFVQKEVLQYEPAASAAPQEGSDRPQPAASPLRPFQRACCAFRRVYDAVQQGERWMRLWARRRRGLVRERIEADRADHIRRIQELEQELRGR